jgi:hypothetical protein
VTARGFVPGHEGHLDTVTVRPGPAAMGRHRATAVLNDHERPVVAACFPASDGGSTSSQGERSAGRHRPADRLRGVPAIGLLVLAGCSPAPSQNILGSYFPSWMICVLAGLGATIVARQLFVAAGIDKVLPAPLFVYVALTGAFAFAIWLAWLD